MDDLLHHKKILNMSIKMPSEEDKKQKSARHETFLKPFTECELHLDKIILNCKSI